MCTLCVGALRFIFLFQRRKEKILRMETCSVNRFNAGTIILHARAPLSSPRKAYRPHYESTVACPRISSPVAYLWSRSLVLVVPQFLNKANSLG